MFGIIPSLQQPPAVEQRSIRLSGQEIPYTLKRSGKRRSIGLRIDERGLTVSMPLRASERWLHSILQERADWVVGKLHSWRARQAPPIVWQDGARIPFRGEALTLHVVPDLFGAPPRLEREQLLLSLPASHLPQHIERQVRQWYREQALLVFKECVDHFAPLMGVAPRELRLSTARTQWGSCNARGVLHLNWQLVKLPLPLIDYVVVHELAHLVEMNHSPAFWRVVATVLPDYAESRAQLRGLALEA